MSRSSLTPELQVSQFPFVRSSKSPVKGIMRAGATIGRVASFGLTVAAGGVSPAMIWAWADAQRAYISLRGEHGGKFAYRVAENRGLGIR